MTHTADNDKCMKLKVGYRMQVRIDHPIVIGAREKLSMIRWMHTQKEQEYELTFGEVENY